MEMALGDTVLVQLGDGVTSPKVTIKITEDAFGNFKFEVTQSGPIVGDLQGIFFDVGGTGAGGVANDALLASTANSTSISGLSATGSGALTNLASTIQDGNDSVKDLGNGNNMNGALGFNDSGAEAKGYDVGIGFGTSGIGKDDVRSVSFTFNNTIGLTIDDFIGMDFGVRMTSVGTLGGARDGSVKLTSSSFQPIADDCEDIDCVVETESESGNVFDPVIEGAGGVTLTQSLKSFTLYDENDVAIATDVFGSPIALPNSEGATITFNADGSYTVNSGSDVLNADDHLPFKLTYTLSQTYTDFNGHVIGQLEDTSSLKFDICGENDTPDAVNDDPDCILEDQSITGNVLDNDTDIDRGDTLTVTHVNGTALVNGVLEIVLPSGAKVTVHEDGSYTYDTNGAFLGLNDGQKGDDSFTYSVSDGNGGVDTATVDICIDGVSPPGGNEPPPSNDFPVWPQNISHIVLYFDQDDGDTKPVVPGGGAANDGDGFYTVKIDDVPGAAADDLDDWISDALDWLITNDPNITADSDLLGAVVKGGTQETEYYAYGVHNLNGTAPDDIPAGAPQISTPPAVGDVNGPLIDASVLYDTIF